MKICIVGGASSTYSAIALLGQNPAHQISLLTRRPEQWTQNIACRMVAPDLSETDRLTARLHAISRNPADVVPDADIILIIAPVHAYNDCLEWLVPHLARGKDVFLGFLYGQGGVNWMANAALRRHGIDNAHYWSFGLIPWISRTDVYGQIGTNYGSKHRNVICTSSDLCYDALKKHILDDFGLKYFGHGEVHRANRFIELTLSVDNQIIHPSRCHALWQSAPNGWNQARDVPYFYRDFDHSSEVVLAGIDQDFEQLRQQVRMALPDEDLGYMMNYLDLEHFSYDSQSPDIRSSFTESKTLFNIGTPVREREGRWVIDAGHRFFLDDTYLGLDIGREFAARFGIAVPMIERVSAWCGELMAAQGISTDALAASIAYRQGLNQGELLA